MMDEQSPNDIRTAAKDGYFWQGTVLPTLIGRKGNTDRNREDLFIV